MDEAEAFRRWREGDASAFDVLYEVVSPRLRSYCRLLAREDGRAADLFQETWARAVRRRDSFREGLPVQAWMAAIARNLWLDTLRRERTEGRILRRLSEGIPEAGHPPESGELLERAQALPSEERDAVLLYHVQGFSLREAAGILGVSTWVLRERLARGLERISPHAGGGEPV